MSERQDDAGQAEAEKIRPDVPPEAFEFEDDVTAEGMALVRARAGVTLAGRRLRRLDNDAIAALQRGL